MATSFRTRLMAASLFCLSVSTLRAADPDIKGLIDAGHYKQARALLEPKVKANPSDAEAAALLSRVKAAYGDLGRAIELAEAAVKLNGKVAEYHWGLALACALKAKQDPGFKSLGLARRFRQEAGAAMQLDPKHVQSRLFSISYYAGAPAIVGGDTGKAEEIAREVAKIDPAWGYIAKARLVEETEPATDKKAASEREALYKKALEAAAAPDARYEALISLANFYLLSETKNFDLAERHARDAAKIDPPRSSPYILLAIANASRKKWAELDAILAESEKVAPDNLGAYYQAGRIIYTQGGDDARAEGYFRKFLTQPPEPGPTLAHAHWRLGLTLEKQGRRAEAITELEEALRLKPDLEEAKKDLKRLRA